LKVSTALKKTGEECTVTSVKNAMDKTVHEWWQLQTERTLCSIAYGHAFFGLRR